MDQLRLTQTSEAFDEIVQAKDLVANVKKVEAVNKLRTNASMDVQFEKAGYNGPIANIVEKQARLAQDAGLDGVVCSAHEIEKLREVCGKDFILMVPGIRPEGQDTQDQKRVMTPNKAIELGASHLVIGRPITQAPDPAEALQNICQTFCEHVPNICKIFVR